MKDDGDVSWIITATGVHPLYDGTTYENQDKCMGISYYKEREQVAVLIQGKMTEVRSSVKGNYYDTILVLLDEGGDTERVTVITQGSLGYDMYASKNGILWQGDNIYFAGYSYGFDTANQRMEKDSDALEYDAYVYKYRFGYSNSCLFLNEPDEGVMKRNMEYTGGTEVEAAGLYSFTTTYRAVPMNKEDNYYVPYVSRYSGGFTLLNTMKIPRPCAAQSQNLTSVQYYRGQNTYQYDIYNQNSAAYLSGDIELIYQNGEDASDIATYNAQQLTIDIQTDADEKVGVQRIIMRSCNELERLLELNLYIEVISNTYPDFVTEP